MDLSGDKKMKNSKKSVPAPKKSGPYPRVLKANLLLTAKIL
jgi:hypothetical protein